jgi:hypothetical protein
VEHQTLKSDRLGPDHLPSWSCPLPVIPGLVPDNPGVVLELSRKGKGRLREVEEEGKGKGGDYSGIIQELKTLHLATCGLASLPPMQIFLEILQSGKPASSIEDVYQLHGGDVLIYRQRNIVEKLTSIRDDDREAQIQEWLRS